MTRFFLILAIVLFPFWTFAQTVISGTILNTKKEPIENVLVKVLNGNKLLTYTSTNDKGGYKLSVYSSAQSVTINFSKLGYAAVSRNVDLKNLRLDISMEEKEIKLKEVVVKAPVVRSKGDTIHYSLKPLLSSGDLTLEDGLKKIPGITVNESGSIKYMGKDISSFYIEGLDVLGGKYNVATKNIAAQNVNSVEVLRHHHQFKIDKKEKSDEVALNIKLNNKVSFKPIGTSEVRTGTRRDKLLYGVGGTGMLFTPTFQTINTVKFSNDGHLGRNELLSHYGGSNNSSIASSALPELGGSRPPLDDYFYESIHNNILGINTIRKMKEGETFRINASCSYLRKIYEYQTESIYPNGDSIVTARESITPRQNIYQPELRLEYLSDNENRLLFNMLKLQSTIRKSDADTYLDDSFYNQHQKFTMFGLSNNLSIRENLGNKQWNFKSAISYFGTPMNRLIIKGKSVPSDWIQKAKSQSFSTDENFSFDYQKSQVFKFSLPLSLSVNYDDLKTDLLRFDTTTMNNLKGWNTKFSVGPSVRLQSTNGKLTADFSLPVNYLILNYKNTAQSKNLNKNKFYLSPQVSLNYIFSSKSELRLTSSLSHNYGDMLDLMTGMIQTNYRNTQSRSGLIGESKNLSSNMRYDWQDPISGWLFTSNASYNKLWNNLLSNQQLSGSDVSVSALTQDNRSDNVFFSSAITKSLISLHTELNLSGIYSWSKSMMALQNEPTVYYGRMYGCSWSLKCNPIPLFEFRYDGNLAKSFSRYSGKESSISSQSHSGSLSFYPAKNLILSSNVKHVHHEISDNHYKDCTLWNANANYTIQKVRLTFEINNLFNIKEYAYTIYSTLNTFSYNYRLQGREFLLTTTINL